MKSIVARAALTLALASTVSCDGTRPAAPELPIAFMGPPGARFATDASSQDHAAGSAAGESEAVAPAIERKVVKNAALALEVPSADRAAVDAATIVATAGGIVTRSSVSLEGEHRTHAQLQARIPVDALDGTLEKLRALGRPLRQETSVRDVTAQFVDVETRLRVKRETEARLRGILRSTGGKVADILEVEKEIDRVVTAIERIEAERRVLESQADLSTVDVEFSEPGRAQPGKFKSRVQGAWRSAGEVLGNSLASLIYIVLYVGPWLLVATILFYVVRTLRRRG